VNKLQILKKIEKVYSAKNSLIAIRHLQELRKQLEKDIEKENNETN